MKIHFILIFAVTLLCSCSKKPDRCLPRYSGTWTSNLKATFSQPGYPDDILYYDSKYQFINRDTLEMIDSSGSVETDIWSYNPDDQTITLSNFQYTHPSIVTYKVVNYSSNEEDWLISDTSYSGGSVYYTTISNHLTRLHKRLLK